MRAAIQSVVLLLLTGAQVFGPVASQGEVIRVRSLGRGAPPPGGVAQAICVDTTGRVAYSAGREGGVLSWSVDTLQVKRRHATKGRVTSVTRHPVQPLLAIAEDGGEGQRGSCFLDLETGARRVFLNRWAMGHAFAPDGRTLALLSVDKGEQRSLRLLLFDVASGRQVAAVRLPDSVVRKVVFSPDGDEIFISSLAHRRHVVVTTGRSMKSAKGAGHVLGFTRAGERLTVGSKSVRRGESPVLELNPDERLTGAMLAPDRESFYLCKPLSVVRVAVSSGAVKEFSKPPGAGYELPGIGDVVGVAAANGALLVSTFWAGVFVRDANRWTQMTAHANDADAACFARDSRTLAIAGQGGVRFLDGKLQTIRILPARHVVAPGARGAEFHVVSEVAIEVMDPTKDAPPRLVAKLPNQFDPGFASVKAPVFDVLRVPDRQCFYFRDARSNETLRDLWLDVDRGRFVPTPFDLQRGAMTLLATHQVEVHPNGHRFLVLRAHCGTSGTGIASFGEWRVHRSSDNKVLHRVFTEPAVMTGCFDRAGKRIYIARSDDQVKIIDAESFAVVRSESMSAPVWMAPWGSERLLAIRSENLLVMDMELRVLQRMPLPGLKGGERPRRGKRYHIVALSNDGQRLAVGHGETVHVFAVDRRD